MVQRIDATYENGVFVPRQQPNLADHQRVRLLVESVSAPTVQPDAQIVRQRKASRIRLDPALARDIASSAEFDPNES